MNWSLSEIAPTASQLPLPAGAHDAPVLAITSLTKRWPRQEKPVLRDVDLELGPGQLVWLTGANGAGKTTLLRIIAGIIGPDAGRIGVCGLEARTARRAYQQRIGLLTAGNSGLYARMTVRQHLDYWARLAFVAADKRGERAEESIERFELGALARRRVDRMSMGQRQRVRIAMTFLHQPTLVLLDEPDNSLDDEGSGLLVGAIEQHLAEGGSAIWCSPGREEPPTKVEQRLRLDSGQLVHS